MLEATKSELGSRRAVVCTSCSERGKALQMKEEECAAHMAALRNSEEKLLESRSLLAEKQRMLGHGVGDADGGMPCRSCSAYQEMLQDQNRALDSLQADNSMLVRMCATLTDQVFNVHLGLPCCRPPSFRRLG
jgi:hypothetical protein